VADSTATILVQVHVWRSRWRAAWARRSRRCSRATCS